MSFVARHLSALALITLGATSCDAFEKMSGCYADAPKKPAALWVTNSDDRYWVARRVRGILVPDSSEVRHATSDEIAKLFGKDSSSIAEGLVADRSPFGVFRIKKGERIRGVDSTANYLGVLFFIHAPLYKVTCE